MRTLCLNLYQKEKASLAENFLVFSPRVHYRDPGLVFLEISTTAPLFGGEKELFSEAARLAREFFPDTQGAIADTPAVAQLLCEERPFHIAKPNQELEELHEAPLYQLKNLEGLIAWSSLREVDQIIDFFSTLGVHKIGQLKQFEIDSLRERWHETGALLWKRLHGLDRQVISPLVATESLEDYVYLDFAVSHLPFLLHCLETSLGLLMQRLLGRGECARKVILQLFCEYSGQVHLIELVPNAPNRDLELYLKLLENKLVDLSLENPVKEFKIEILPATEKIQQLDFWEPRHKESDKLNQAVSLFKQASLSTGYLSPRDEVFPEDSWELMNIYEEASVAEDVIEVSGQSLRIRPAYAKSLHTAPRPSQLLKSPRRLSSREVRRLQFLSTHPVERLEGDWWEDTRGRDYFFATSPQGHFLWVYFDRIEQQYFLHGYFD
jgi:protein ImuB